MRKNSSSVGYQVQPAVEMRRFVSTCWKDFFFVVVALKLIGVWFYGLHCAAA